MGDAVPQKGPPVTGDVVGSGGNLARAVDAISDAVMVLGQCAQRNRLAVRPGKALRSLVFAPVRPGDLGGIVQARRLTVAVRCYPPGR